MPDRSLELACPWPVAGVDEAGRGPWAGPVCAGAVILADDVEIAGLDDSKKLPAARREALAPEIRARALAWGVGFALNKSMGVYGPNPSAFGHHGWGGSFGFADPEKQLGVAYAMNMMREPTDGPDPRFMGLVQAVYASV